MKIVPTPVLALAAMVILAGPAFAQQKATGASGPAGAVANPPATAGPTAGRTSPASMTGSLTGKVTAVDAQARTFAVMVQGRAISFSAAALGKLPTVGQSVDVAFTARPGERPTATSIAETGAGASAQREKKKYQHCDDHTHGQNPLNSLNACTY
jgi:hypothetical protein